MGKFFKSLFFNLPVRLCGSEKHFARFQRIYSTLFFAAITLCDYFKVSLFDQIPYLQARPNIITALHWIIIVSLLYITISGFLIDCENQTIQEKYEKLKEAQEKLKTALEKITTYRTLILESHETLLESELRQIADSLMHNPSLTQLDFNEARLSMYIYKQHSETFQLFARFSKDPKKKDKGKRIEFNSEGIIQRVWNKEKYSDADFLDPESNLKAYISRHVDQYKLSKAFVEKIRFKARTYAGIRISDAT